MRVKWETLAAFTCQDLKIAIDLIKLMAIFYRTRDGISCSLLIRSRSCIPEFLFHSLTAKRPCGTLALRLEEKGVVVLKEAF